MDSKVKCKNGIIRLAYKYVYWDEKNFLNKSNCINQKVKIGLFDYIKN